jgi:hypothetical protein
MVPSIPICGQKVIVLGKWVKIACVHDEAWTKGQVIVDPEQFISLLKASHLKADIFTFCQKLPETQPKYNYYFEWDNVAAIPLSTFDDWWEKRLPQVTRKNVRRSLKRGVIVKIVDLNDDMLMAITDIFNERPVREGKKFPHFGKDFETVKKEVSTILDRCIFIGAYYGDELIGYIKLVFMGPIASILNIVSKIKHSDKRPTNALISKAVEVSIMHGASYLIYGKYTYGNKSSSSLAEFKRRNGFEQISFPRYYIPLSIRGKIILRLNLHKGMLGLLPPFVIIFLVNLRSKLYQLRTKYLSKNEIEISQKDQENGH